MAEQSVGMIGIVMPDLFPQETLAGMWEYLIRPPSPIQPLPKRVGEELFWEFGNACLGIERRFKAADDHSIAFTALIAVTGVSISPDDVYHQDRELFDFIVNGFSVLECFAYGAYFIGSFIEPSGFALVASENERRKIDLNKVGKEYQSHFPGKIITSEINALLNDPVYINWKFIRNIVSHRSHPGRVQYLSNTPRMERPSEWKVPDLPALDVNTTTSRFTWLADSLAKNLGALSSLVRDYL